MEVEKWDNFNGTYCREILEDGVSLLAHEHKSGW